MTSPTFLSLPSELRRIVYSALFQDSFVTLQLETSWDPERNMTSEVLASDPHINNRVLFVCRQTYDKACPVSRKSLRLIFQKGASAEDLQLASQRKYVEISRHVEVRPLTGDCFDPKPFSCLESLDIRHGRRPYRTFRINDYKSNRDSNEHYAAVVNGELDDILKSFARSRYSFYKGFEWIERSWKDPNRAFRMTADLAFILKQPTIRMKNKILVGPHSRPGVNTDDFNSISYTISIVLKL